MVKHHLLHSEYDDDTDHGQLPSFDQLLKSINHHPSTTLVRSTSPSSVSKSIPFSHPRKTACLTDEPPFTPLDQIHRPPSTPPIRGPHQRTRARASTAPALLQQPPSSPSCTPRKYGGLGRQAIPLGCGGVKCGHGHTLGLSRRPSCEHYGDRIKEIRDGDGDWTMNDIVSPLILPPRARPRYHGRHYSTTSLPSLPVPHHHFQRDSTSPLHSAIPLSTDYTKINHQIITHGPLKGEDESHVKSSHGHSHSFGSHSPLSMCSPLTPHSDIGFSIDRDRESRSREENAKSGWWRYERGSKDDERDHDFMPEQASNSVKIPALPRMA